MKRQNQVLVALNEREREIASIPGLHCVFPITDIGPQKSASTYYSEKVVLLSFIAGTQYQPKATHTCQDEDPHLI